MDGREMREYLRKVAAEHGVRTFVETGTSDANTAAHLAEHFDRLYTIELDHGFYLQAVWRFLEQPHVRCLYGDSQEVLEHLVYRIHEPAMFWLDAHFCGGVRGMTDTPVLFELQHILRWRGGDVNVILIDDARLFGVDPAYPTLDWIHQSVKDLPYDVTVKHDIIHVLPR